MSQPGTQGDRRRERWIVNGLWIASAMVVVTGFIVRFLSSLFGHRDLRLAGVGLIAAGVAVAVLGWIGERIVARRAH